MGERDGGGGHIAPWIQDRAEADGEDFDIPQEGLAPEDHIDGAGGPTVPSGNPNLRGREEIPGSRGMGPYTARSIQDFSSEVGRRDRPEVPAGYREIRDDLNIPAVTHVTVAFRKSKKPPALLEAVLLCLTCDESFEWVDASRWYECSSCEAELTEKEAKVLVDMALSALTDLSQRFFYTPPPSELAPIPKRKSIWEWLMFWRRPKAPQV